MPGTPYLEKRLIGLSAPPPPPPPRPPRPTPRPRPPLLLTPARPRRADDIKEMINLTIRRHEYAAASTGDAARAQHGGRGGWESLLPVEGMADSWSSPETLVEWLQREKTVELIFGEGLHAQVVSRCCVELLGFLAMQGALDGGHIELIWRASLDKHESVKQPIYQTLADLTAHLPPERQAQLYSHIKSVPFAEYTKDVLALLRGFAIGAPSRRRSPASCPAQAKATASRSSGG